MEMHPAGVPRLVGPAGSQFSQPDFSSQFRFLPSNSTNEMSPSPRSYLQPLLSHASLSNSRQTGSHPFRLWGEFRTGNPRVSSSPQHLLPSDSNPPSNALSSPAAQASAISTPLSTTQDKKEADFLVARDYGGDLLVSDYYEDIQEFLIEDGFLVIS